MTLSAASSRSVWLKNVFVSGFICESARTAAGTFFGQPAFHSSTVDMSLALSTSNSASTKRSRSASLSCGVEPWVFYGTESPELYDAAIANGARLFTANDPAWAMNYLREKGLHR